MEQIFINSTYVKACANNRKMRKKIVKEKSLWYEKIAKRDCLRLENT